MFAKCTALCAAALCLMPALASANPPYLAATDYAAPGQGGSGVGVASVDPPAGATVERFDGFTVTFDRPFRAGQLTTNQYNGNSSCESADSVLLIEFWVTYDDGRSEGPICMGMQARPVDAEGYVWRIDLRRPLESHWFHNGLGDPHIYTVRELDVRFVLRPDTLDDQGAYYAWVGLRDARGALVRGATVLDWHVSETPVEPPSPEWIEREGMVYERRSSER